jgi:hypothetical protein
VRTGAGKFARSLFANATCSTSYKKVLPGEIAKIFSVPTAWN